VVPHVFSSFWVKNEDPAFGRVLFIASTSILPN
jgi:hypothetical protein